MGIVFEWFILMTSLVTSVSNDLDSILSIFCVLREKSRWHFKTFVSVFSSKLIGEQNILKFSRDLHSLIMTA